MEQPWLKKYWPTDFSDVKGNVDIMNSISSQLKENALVHYIFAGPPGVGKSTCMRLIVNHYCKNIDKKLVTLELNASSDRGIEVVRKNIKEFCKSALPTAPGTPPFKLALLDEADSLTSAAQEALRCILDEFADHVRFIFCVNNSTKIIPAIQSRCCIHRFKALDDSDIRDVLLKILSSEQVPYSDESVEFITKYSAGDVRRAVHMAQSAHMAFTNIDINNLHLMFSDMQMVRFDAIINEVLNDRCWKALLLAREVMSDGVSPIDASRALLDAVLRSDITPDLLHSWTSVLAEHEDRIAKGDCSRIAVYGMIGLISDKNRIFLEDAIGLCPELAQAHVLSEAPTTK